MPQIWEQGRPTRRQLTFDLCCGAGFALMIGGLYLSAGVGPVLVVLILAAAIAVRRLSVSLMIASGMLAAVIQLAMPKWQPALAVADVAYAALFFVLGAHPRAAIRRFGLLSGLVGLVTLAIWAGVGHSAPIAGQDRMFYSAALTAMAAVVLGGGWIAGYLRLQRRRSIQAELDAQFEQVERRRLADEYEHAAQRSRIAADMHDTIAHSWAVVAAQADGARYTLADNPAATEQALEVIAETARSTIADLRTILAELRDAGAEPTTPGHDQHDRLLQRMRLTGLDIQHHQIGGPGSSPLLALTAYRLLGEALTNALKHGDLRQPVTVTEDWRDGYRLHVVNTIGQHGDGTGHGIIGMVERATIAGGRLESRGAGKEWVVDAVIPAPHRSSAPTSSDDLKETTRS